MFLKIILNLRPERPHSSMDRISDSGSDDLGSSPDGVTKTVKSVSREQERTTITLCCFCPSRHTLQLTLKIQLLLTKVSYPLPKSSKLGRLGSQNSFGV